MRNRENEMSYRNRNRRLRQGEAKGVVAVEFAIVLPFILFIFLAAIELANLNFVRNMANDSAYRAARALIVPGGDSDAAINAGIQTLEDVGISGASITIEESDDKIVADVSIPIGENSWSIGMLAAHSTIEESCTLRKSYRPRN